MIGNKQTFLKKKQKDDNYVCPHTLVYDIEFGDREPTDVTYYFLLKNTACSSGATIDFGDGVISTNVRSNPDYDALSAATILSHTYTNASGTYRVSFDMNDISKFKRPSDGNDFALFGISAPYWQIATSGTAYVIKDDVFLQNKKYWTWADKFIGINKNESWYPITIVDFNEIELCSALYNWPVFSHVNDVKMSNRQFQKLQSNSLLRRSGNFNSIVSPIHHLELGENDHSPHGYGYAKCIFPDLTNISIKAPIKPQTFQDVNVRTVNNETQYFNDNIITVNEVPSMSDVLSGAYFAGLGCKCLNFSRLSSYTTICSSLCEASNVREVILPNSINKIEKFAFENCYSLSSINLENIETIGEYAFCGCPLVSANLNNLVSIDDAAFDSCEKMTSIDAPRLSVVPYRGFSYCKSLSSINIPCATYIGMNAFRRCDSLISADFSNVTYIEMNGIDQCESLTYVNASSALEIGDWAFFYDTALTSVNIENTTYLGEGTFEECYALTGINAKNVRSLSCNWTFWGCSSLISADIRNATSIGKEVFEDCFALKYVDARSAKTVGSNAFNNCNSLEVVNLSSVQSLTNGAFQHTRLKSIDISNLPTINDSVFYGCADLIDVKATNATLIENNAFGACTSLSTIDLPNVITIKNNAFLNCDALSSVSLNTAKIIYPSAFSGCSSIVSATVGGLDTLDVNVFKDSKYALKYIDACGLSAVESGCFSNFYTGYTALETINVSGATIIGESAFDSCSSLLHINASNAVTIGDAAFYGCEGLTSLNLSKATTIGEGALDKCSSLIYLNVASMTELDHDIFIDCYDSLQFIDASGLSAIESGTFSSLTALLSANINGVTEIGPSAFNGCSSLQYINADNAAIISSNAFANCSSLVDVNISSAIELGPSAFYKCTNLLSVNTENVRTVDERAFAGCSSVSSFYFPNIDYISVNAFAGCSPKSVYFEGNLSGIPDYSSFAGCSELEYVHLPSAITTIGYRAFNSCSNLINIENFDKVKRISNYAFSGCKLSSVILSNAEYIGSYAFTPNYDLKNVEITGSSLTAVLQSQAFASCSSLTDVSLTNIDRINQEAFYCCDNISSIILTNVNYVAMNAFAPSFNTNNIVNLSAYLKNVKTLGQFSFQSNKSLRYIDLSDVEEIGLGAFAGCVNLSSINNMNNIQILNGAIFDHCTSLTDVCAENATFMSGAPFYYCTSLTSVYLPKMTTIMHEDGAFGYCSSLISVNLASMTSISDALLSSSKDSLQYLDVSSLSSATSAVFEPLTALVSANLSGAEIIDELAFHNSSVKKVIVDNAAVVGRNAFVNCTNLSSISLPHIKTLGHMAFAGCDNLTSAYLEGSLSSIPTYCFVAGDSCKLKYVHLPSGIENIGTLAFAGQSGLTTVDGLSNVKYIYMQAFQRSWTHISISSKYDRYGRHGICRLS